MSFKFIFPASASQFSVTWVANSALLFSPFIYFLPPLKAEKTRLGDFTGHVPTTPGSCSGSKAKVDGPTLSFCLHPSLGHSRGISSWCKAPKPAGICCELRVWTKKPDTQLPPGLWEQFPWPVWFIVTIRMIRMIYLSFQAHFLVPGAEHKENKPENNGHLKGH